MPPPSRGNRSYQKIPSASKQPALTLYELVLVAAGSENRPTCSVGPDRDPVARCGRGPAVDGDNRVQRQVTSVGQGAGVGILADHVGDGRPALEG